MAWLMTKSERVPAAADTMADSVGGGRHNDTESGQIGSTTKQAIKQMDSK